MNIWVSRGDGRQLDQMFTVLSIRKHVVKQRQPSNRPDEETRGDVVVGSKFFFHFLHAMSVTLTRPPGASR